MDEPYVESTTYTYDTTATVATETCNASSFAENGGTDRHWVPHFLPGQNTALGEWLKDGGLDSRRADARRREDDLSGVPRDAERRRGQGRRSEGALVASRRSTWPSGIADQSPRDGEVHILPVQGNVYMLVADGTNLTVVARCRRRPAGEHRHGADVRQDPGGRQPARQRGLAQPDGQQVLRRELSRDVGLVQPVHERGDQLAGAARAASLHHQHQRGAGARRRQREDRDLRLLPARLAVRRRGRERRAAAPRSSRTKNVLNRMSAPAGQGRADAGGVAGRPTPTSTSSTSCPSTSTAKR